MAEEVEKKEEVTVNTPEENKETTEETVVEQPTDTTKDEKEPTATKKKGGMSYKLTSWQEAPMGAPKENNELKGWLANQKANGTSKTANEAIALSDTANPTTANPNEPAFPTLSPMGTANPPQGTEGSSAFEDRDAEGVTEEPENQGGQEPQGEEQPTEAGSEENAEGVAEEVQAIDPSTIPTDPDDFQEWVQSKPELKQFYDFMINDSDAKLKASQKKQRREQMGVALGNLMRAFVNLGTTMHGGLNSYNHESADKIRKEAGEQEEKWRTELEKNRKDRWEQYQKLRDQYFKENADRRAASKEVREERKELFNEEQRRYDRKLKEAKDRRDEMIVKLRADGMEYDNAAKKANAEYAEEKNRLDNEHKEAQIRLANARIADIGANAANREERTEQYKKESNARIEKGKEDETPSAIGGSGKKPADVTSVFR